MSRSNFDNRHAVACFMVYVTVLVSLIIHCCYWSNKYDEISTYEANFNVTDSTGFCVGDWFPYTSKDTLTVCSKNGEYRFFVSKLERTPKESYVLFKPVASDLTMFNKSTIEIRFKNKEKKVKIHIRVHWYDSDAQNMDDYYSYRGYSLDLDKFIIANLDVLKQKYHKSHDCYDIVYTKHQGLTQIYLFSHLSNGEKDKDGIRTHLTKKLNIVRNDGQ